MFEPTTIEIRFHHLAKVQGEPNQGYLVPVIARQPSPEDGPGYVPLVFPFFALRYSKCKCVDVIFIGRATT